ncbi:MAG: hypothetical protein RMH77_01685 [Sulfolobales archaeon]|nr:hypothetical protein [Sulfolobales archaeon]MCX8185842.1 hypothetical protein [Sulfolobales archaeon]MDW7969099.1 hypothetical protein [Sulfolobales archaeon]
MKLIVTTSREPSRRTRSFVKDLTSTINGLIKISRGKRTLKDLLNIVHSYDCKGVLMVLERAGNPSALSYYVERDGNLDRMFLIKLSSIKLIREISGAQRPSSPCKPVVDNASIEGDIPTDVVDVIKTVLNAANGLDTRNAGEAVRLKFKHAGTYVSLTFECVASGRICGPELRILKVVSNAI